MERNGKEWKGMERNGKGRESFSESCLLKNADVSVRKRLPTLCTRQYGTVQLRSFWPFKPRIAPNDTGTVPLRKRQRHRLVRAVF